MVFLYPEDAAQTAYARERAAENTPVVYLYQPGEEWCIWDVTNELLAYPEIYFAVADREDVIRDDKIRNADLLVVYLPKNVETESCLEKLCADNEVLTECQCQLVFEEKYCDVYYVSSR